jgi:hypothetical protein
MHHKTKKKLDYLRNYIKKQYKLWEKKYPNIIGAYPGEKITKNLYTGRYSIVFLVSRKLKYPSREIPKSFIVNFPQEGQMKIPTDVIKTEKIKFRAANLSDRTKRINLQSFGSIGAFLTDGVNIYACTNAHVLLPDMIRAGKTYFQPDTILFNSSGQTVNSFLQEGFFDDIDAVISRVEDNSLVGNSIPGFGIPTGTKNILTNEINYPLQMAGSVTGISRGRVLRIGMTLSTPLSNVYLNDIIEASIFSQKGDSGAPVFNDALKIIGIILGGTSTTTYILPINKLLSSFQCNLLT